MLTRALFALVLTTGLASYSGAAKSQDTKLLAFGIADHEVTAEEVEKGEAVPVPRFNTGAVAYVLVANVKKGDIVEIVLNNGDTPLLRNTETLAEDKPKLLLQAGKRGVPAGGWPEGTYTAAVTITRDGKKLITETTKPMIFE